MFLQSSVNAMQLLGDRLVADQEYDRREDLISYHS